MRIPPWCFHEPSQPSQLLYIAQVEVYTVVSFARLQLQHFAVELEQLKDKKQAGTFESVDLSFVHATVNLCSETMDAVKATTARMKPLLPKRETPIKDGPEVECLSPTNSGPDTCQDWIARETGQPNENQAFAVQGGGVCSRVRFLLGPRGAPSGPGQGCYCMSSSSCSRVGARLDVLKI